MKKRSPETPREFSYSADLSEHPLPDLLFTIGQYKVPGVISFSHRQVIKQVFIHEGKIIFAASNFQEDHLGEFLFHCGKINRSDLDKSIPILSRSKGKRQGEILVQLKALPEQELAWAVRSHQQAIVWSLFNWFEGDVKFSIGTYKQEEPILLDLPIPRAILDGVRNIHQAKRAINFIGNRHTVLEASENSLLAIEVFGADEKEREILKRVDGKITLYDLCASAPYGAHETAKILYGLLTLRLIRRTEGIRVASSLPKNNFL